MIGVFLFSEVMLMQVSSVNQSTAAYSFGQSQNIVADQMATLISASQQIQSAPMQQKMVLAVNAAVESGSIDIYA